MIDLDNPIEQRLKRRKKQGSDITTGSSVRDEIFKLSGGKSTQSNSIKRFDSESEGRKTADRVFGSSTPIQPSSSYRKINRTDDDYESVREGLKFSAQKDNAISERMAELRKSVLKLPESKQALDQYLRDREELKQLEAQKSNKFDPIDDTVQAPPSTDKLDVKLSNIDKALKSGSEGFGYNIKEPGRENTKVYAGSSRA